MGRISGSLLMLLGYAGLGLLLALRTGELPGWLGFRVLNHAPMWAMASTFCVGLGTWMMWTYTHLRTGWRPIHPGRRFNSVVLYTRSICPLCDEAREVLAEYRRWLPATIEVDIDQDAALKEVYGESIPVVVIDNKLRFKGLVSEVLLRRLIEGAEPIH